MNLNSVDIILLHMSECVKLLNFCSSTFTSDDIGLSFYQIENIQDYIRMIQDGINCIQKSMPDTKMKRDLLSSNQFSATNPSVENDSYDSDINNTSTSLSAELQREVCFIAGKKFEKSNPSENNEGQNLLANDFDRIANHNVQLVKNVEYNAFASNTFSAMFDSRGGELRNDSLTSNRLIIPPNAIPERDTYEISSRVCISYSSFRTIASEEDICFISPVMEYAVENNYNFQKHVKVVIYPEVICCGDSFNNILVFAESNGAVYEIPNKQHNCVSDCWFQINVSSVVIYTRHFSKFVCLLKGLMHKKKVVMTLKTLLFGQIESNDDCSYYARLQYYNLFNCNEGLWNVFWKVSDDLY